VEDFAEAIRAMRSPWVDMMGLVIESATPGRVTATLVVDPEKHMQPVGLVHGGVFASIGETLASMGAVIDAMAAGKNAAGMENHTSFIRSVSGAARLTAVAEALHRGRTTQSWEVRITDEEGRLVARSYVRMALIDQR
jgi:uncharacterized protein (TIGR00369 family)